MPSDAAAIAMRRGRCVNVAAGSISDLTNIKPEIELGPIAVGGEDGGVKALRERQAGTVGKGQAQMSGVRAQGRRGDGIVQRKSFYLDFEPQNVADYIYGIIAVLLHPDQDFAQIDR